MKLKPLLVAFFAFWSLTLFAHNRQGIEYVANQGQWDGRVLFRAAMGHGAVFVENDGITFSFVRPEDLNALHDFLNAPINSRGNFFMSGHAWRMKFIGSSVPQVAGEQPFSHYYNYFIGNDPSRWASRVPVYQSALLSGLYQGIDLRTHGSGANFKYDFIVHPGAQPSSIRWTYSGLDGLTLRDGVLILETSVGEFTEARPYAFQVIDGRITEVPCRYTFNGNSLGFEFPEGYDTSRDLIVDPELIAATLSGTTGVSNYGHTATFDIEGNIYTGAISFGVGYPTTDGAFQEDYSSGGGWGTDFGLSKLDPEGVNLIWASYLGGGSGDHPHSMWANDFGELYVYGTSESSDFPTSPTGYDTSHNGGQDIVVSKLSADGTTLMGSTYIGGNQGDGANSSSVNYGDTYRGEIILDGNGKVHIASCSSSADFPTTLLAYQPELAGGQDGVYCRLNNNLSNLETSTFIGGQQSDMAYGLRTNTDGDVYICGMAGSDDFPVTAGAYQTTYIGSTGGWGGEKDGFIARFNAGASTLEKCTYLGTEEEDQCFFIDLDNDENVFVYGQGGSDMPVVGSVYSNPGSRQFITKLDADLSTVLVGTVVGSGGGGWGGTDFVPDAFLVDHCNNIYISSYQASAGLETTPDALYTTGGFYLAVFTEDIEELEYGTFYTGNHVDGGTSRFDKNGTVYQAVCSGGGFATTPDAWATTQNGGWDIGVFKIDFDVSGVNSAITAPDLSGCAPYVVQFENYSTGDQFFWDFGDGTTSTEFEPDHTYEDPGVYDVVMIASDSLSCNLADTSSFQIAISTPVEYFPSFEYSLDCATMSIITENTTGYDFLEYIWDMGDGTIIEEDSPTHSYAAPGDYEITLTAVDNGCDSDSTVTQSVTIYNEVVAIIDNEDLDGCAPFDVDFQNSGAGGTYTWDFGDGTPVQTGNNVMHTYEEPGDYVVTLYAEGNEECVGADTTASIVTVIAPPFIDAVFTANQFDDCVLLNLETQNQSIGPDLTYSWSFGDGNMSTEENPDHTYTIPGDYIISLTIIDGTCGGQDQTSQTVTLLDQIDLQLPEDVFICYYEESTDLIAVDPGPDATYLWSTGETTPTITVTEPGDYAVEVFFNNCEYTDTVTVDVGAETPHFDEVKFCQGSNQFLNIPYAGGTWYSWCTGETEQGITVVDGGEYCYQYMDTLGCVQEGLITATVLPYEASLYIPNAFTPNNDNINDVFMPVGEGVDEFEMHIFNRWGEEVFKSEDMTRPWDGSYKEREHYVPDGVYPYLITYRGECNAEKVEKAGYIVVVR